MRGSLPPSSGRALLRRFGPRIVASLLIASGFVWVFKRGGLPLAPPAGAQAYLQWWGAPAFFLLNALVSYFRTQRLLYLIRPLEPNASSRTVIGIGLIGYSAIFFAPMRLGEVVRPYLLSRHLKLSFGQGVGMVAAERIIDGLSIVVMTMLGLMFSKLVEPLPDHIGRLPLPISAVPGALSSATALFGAAFVGMAITYAFRARAVSLVRALVSPISARLAEAVAGLLLRVLEGFAFLRNVRSGLTFVGRSALSWLLLALAQLVLMRSIGLAGTLAIASVSAGLLALGSLLPAGPGFFGAYQMATYTALAMFFPMELVTSRGALFVFVSYAAHVALNLAMPFVGWLLLRRNVSDASSVLAD